VKPTELLTKSGELSTRRTGSYRVGLAATSNEILAAQRLRDYVFTNQTGAGTPGPPGIDADEFDAHCDHLIVWHRPLHQHPDQPPEHVVATYRLLPPHRNHSVPRARGLYSAQEFDLTRLERMLPTTVEARQSVCSSGPPHRNGHFPVVGRNSSVHAINRQPSPVGLRVDQLGRGWARHGRRVLEYRAPPAMYVWCSPPVHKPRTLHSARISRKVRPGDELARFRAREQHFRNYRTGTLHSLRIVHSLVPR